MVLLFFLFIYSFICLCNFLQFFNEKKKAFICFLKSIWYLFLKAYQISYDI